MEKRITSTVYLGYRIEHSTVGVACGRGRRIRLPGSHGRSVLGRRLSLSMENKTPQDVSTTTETVRTPACKRIAKIVTDHETGVKSAYDELGTLMARYNPRADITYDHQGRAVSRGNSLIAMALDCGGRTAANSPPRG